MTSHYRLQRLPGGAVAVHNTAYGQTMHPIAGPWAEANSLYVEGSGLAALLCRRAPGPLVLFDVGLGAAANALAAVDCHAQLARQGRAPRALHVVSFESDPQAARFAIAEAAALQYPRGHEEALARLLDTGTAEPAPGVHWALRLGDFPALLAEEPARPEVVFFDPFSPKANPEMWRLSTLEALHRCRPRAAELRLLTYSTAFGTRAGLLLAGFFVGEGPRQSPHRGSTFASTRAGDVARPLTRTWLARWRKDREPWPPGTLPGDHRALRERLLEHPQWPQEAAAEANDAPARRPRPSRRPAGTPEAPRSRAGGRRRR